MAEWGQFNTGVGVNSYSEINIQMKVDIYTDSPDGGGINFSQVINTGGANGVPYIGGYNQPQQPAIAWEEDNSQQHSPRRKGSRRNSDENRRKHKKHHESQSSLASKKSSTRSRSGSEKGSRRHRHRETDRLGIIQDTEQSNSISPREQDTSFETDTPFYPSTSKSRPIGGVAVFPTNIIPTPAPRATKSHVSQQYIVQEPEPPRSPPLFRPDRRLSPVKPRTLNIQEVVINTFDDSPDEMIEQTNKRTPRVSFPKTPTPTSLDIPSRQNYYDAHKTERIGLIDHKIDVQKTESINIITDPKLFSRDWIKDKLSPAERGLIPRDGPSEITTVETTVITETKVEAVPDQNRTAHRMILDDKPAPPRIKYETLIDDPAVAQPQSSPTPIRLRQAPQLSPVIRRDPQPVAALPYEPRPTPIIRYEPLPDKVVHRNLPRQAEVVRHDFEPQAAPRQPKTRPGIPDFDSHKVAVDNILRETSIKNLFSALETKQNYHQVPAPIPANPPRSHSPKPTIILPPVAAKPKFNPPPIPESPPPPPPPITHSAHVKGVSFDPKGVEIRHMSSISSDGSTISQSNNQPQVTSYYDLPLPPPPVIHSANYSRSELVRDHSPSAPRKYSPIPELSSSPQTLSSTRINEIYSTRRNGMILNSSSDSGGSLTPTNITPLEGLNTSHSNDNSIDDERSDVSGHILRPMVGQRGIYTIYETADEKSSRASVASSIYSVPSVGGINLVQTPPIQVDTQEYQVPSSYKQKSLENALLRKAFFSQGQSASSGPPLVQVQGAGSRSSIDSERSSISGRMVNALGKNSAPILSPGNWSGSERSTAYDENLSDYLSTNLLNLQEPGSAGSTLSRNESVMSDTSLKADQSNPLFADANLPRERSFAEILRDAHKKPTAGMRLGSSGSVASSVQSYAELTEEIAPKFAAVITAEEDALRSRTPYGNVHMAMTRQTGAPTDL